MAALDADGREEIKVVGKSGQISLGKRFSGRRMRVEHRRDGTIVLTPVVVVPESQLWTLREPDASRIRRGLAWAKKTPPGSSDVEALIARAERGPKRGSRRGPKR